jgi:hypothetical protein
MVKKCIRLDNTSLLNWVGGVNKKPISESHPPFTGFFEIQQECWKGFIAVTFHSIPRETKELRRADLGNNECCP